jgi:TolB-like protein/cytochrome c-type biogenesis protein CcmH/NrfG
VLRILVENRDNLVSRDRLLQEVWRERIVTDDSIVQCLVDIRRVLSRIDRQAILTLPGRGYVFQSDRVAGGPGGPAPSRWARIATGIGAGVVALILLARIPADESVPEYADERPSIAVLPFSDMTETQDKRFMAEGLSDEILNQLAGSRNLRVMSRTSSFAFSTDRTPVRTIADELGVSHVLEGSVRQGDDRLRVTVQLIDARDSSHRWSQIYDRPLGDILDVQLDIARSVAHALDVTLNRYGNDDQSANPFAHALVIQARSELRLGDIDSNHHAQRLLRRALQIEPDNVSALAVLALAVRRDGGPRGSDVYHSAWQHSIELIDRALALNPDHSFAVAQRGWAELYYYQDYAAAARSVERAMLLDPTNPEVIRLATNALVVFGQPEDATRLGRYVTDRDPLCISCQAFLAVTASASGNLTLAEDTARHILELDPAYSPAYEVLGDVLLAKGEPASALTVLRNRVDERAGILLSKAVAYYELGQMDEFARMRQRMIDLYADLSPSHIARLEAFTGNVDEAFAWLERQLAKPRWARGVNYRSAYYDNLRADPRWDDYLNRFGLSPGQLARIDFSPTLPF